MALFKWFPVYLVILLAHVHMANAQSIAVQLNNAVKMLEADSQLKHGIIGFSVIDSKTGKTVFERNAQLGLAAASCQKVITSGAAFELLGNNYRYKTELGYSGKIENGVLNGDLFVTGNGDPTLGSWRYTSTTDRSIYKRWMASLKKLSIQKINGYVIGDDTKFSHQLIPGGWIWDDVGNYYGAGAGALNWRENQYDLILRSGKKPGDSVQMVYINPPYYAGPFLNELRSAAEGSGDQSFIYLPALQDVGLVSGTIPINQNRFSISGSVADPTQRVEIELRYILDSLQIGYHVSAGKGDKISVSPDTEKASVIFDTYESPSLDSITYWFLKKSINLYGEALIKTIACEKTGKGSTQKGVEIVKDFWSAHGIEKSAVNIQDGSGLSPQNRITADALVKVMVYAKSRPWFGSFYNALPEINNLKMKSGSIGGARSFTGYSKSRDGAEYTFAIIVNNYDGSAGDMVRKMYRILDILK